MKVVATENGAGLVGFNGNEPLTLAPGAVVKTRLPVLPDPRKPSELKHLEHGGHVDPHNGMCLMEAVSYFAREPFGAFPACVDGTLAQAGRGLNDTAKEYQRDLLLPLIPRLIGTAEDGKRGRRIEMMRDFARNRMTAAMSRHVEREVRYQQLSFLYASQEKMEAESWAAVVYRVLWAKRVTWLEWFAFYTRLIEAKPKLKLNRRLAVARSKLKLNRWLEIEPSALYAAEAELVPA